MSRRPSMAERRSSINKPEQEALIVPHLAGIEEPLPETIPEECDVVICGTGLVESILAAALSWQGSNVLHIDANDYYGDNTATLTIDQLQKWVKEVNNNEHSGFRSALLHIPRPQDLNSRDYGIDLTPKILFAKSDLLALLVKSKVYKYLEFLPLSTFHVFENDNFEKLSSTKQDIFTNQSLTLVAKRSLMKFIKFAINWENEKSIWEPYRNKTFEKFLKEQFKLSPNQIYELIFSIGLCNNLDINTPEALLRIKRYLTSFDVYGNFPILYSKFGGAGELSQGFCRSAAVAGTTYKLNTSLISFNPTTKIAKFSDNSHIKVNENLILSESQTKSKSFPNVPKKLDEIQRLTVIVKKCCKEWFENGENACIVVFPIGSLSSNNKQAVQAIIMGEETGITSKNTCVWYLSTIESGAKGKLDLEVALKAMENSILRESSEFEINDFIENDGVLNSVKLGQSFKDFVPKEKIQYLLKLYYVQATSIPHTNVVNTELIEKFIKKVDSPNDLDDGVIYSILPTSEISYDGVISVAKKIYEKIVGSDDDFFDVDFEDDEDLHSNREIDESAIEEEDEADPLELADDMEL